MSEPTQADFEKARGLRRCICAEISGCVYCLDIARALAAERAAGREEVQARLERQRKAIEAACVAGYGRISRDTLMLHLRGLVRGRAGFRSGTALLAILEHGETTS